MCRQVAGVPVAEDMRPNPQGQLRPSGRSGEGMASPISAQAAAGSGLKSAG
jgi:hypothetical protein